ncbi:hypothetical protein EAE32_10120 [Kocuria tytonicola]|uniref:Glycoside hydrolase family 2 immunoglobulin-like beta-sandwich domain-containing protein n=1 Tax=Kocuria tytonicola TaxID=2055946 RepID=A0A3L9L531_9MICC|nr:hypothetical protein EAE32_10120 [Kocuria tytonicola]
MTPVAQDVLARASWRLHLVGAAAGGGWGDGVALDAAASGAEAPREATSPGRDACHHGGPRPGEQAPAGGRAATSERPTATWGAALAEGITARVPGTVTGALRDALGEQAVDRVLQAAGPDAVWEYRTRVSTAGGPHRFTSTGVATVARLLVTGHEVHACDTAFLPWDVTVELPPGPCEIVLRLLPLASVPVPRTPRARWLSPLVPDRSLRWRRTPLVGAIDWPGARPVLGPWGGLSAHPEPAPHHPAAPPWQEAASDDAAASGSRHAEPVAVRTRVAENGDGVVTVRCAGARLFPGRTSSKNRDAALRETSAPEAPEAPEAPAAPATPETPERPDDASGAVGAVDPGGSSVRVQIDVTRTGSGGVTGALSDPRSREPSAASGDQAADEAGVSCEHTVSPADVDGSGTVTFELTVPRPALWWPHGMGEQPLYRVRVRAAGVEHTATVGFRTLEAASRDAGHHGLGLEINRVPLFVRGAVWTGADPFEVAAPADRLRAVLTRLRDGGATMVRIPGTGCYETEDFHRACDELGLLVWQDVALGPLDPPDEPGWRAGLRDEVRALASRLAVHPSTAVVSGGTEVIQAPVLAGRPTEQWAPAAVLHDVPTAVGEADADVVVVPSSPCSDAHLDTAHAAHDAARRRVHEGDVEPDNGVCPDGAAGTEEASAASSKGIPDRSPVDAADGVCHYFGVGAYGRPLEDAVTRGVRFAAECLAFAVPPEPAVVRAQFGTGGPLDAAESAGAWRRGLAHDPGAAWTFEETTVTYVHRLFLDRDSDPDAGLAHPARPAPQDVLGDHERLLEHERAALSHVFQRTFTQWRASSSACRGALVLSAASTAPGAGWGVLDVTGRPTAAWYGMRRACAPVALSFLPAGGDGLALHVFNDAPQPLHGSVRLTVATVRGSSQPPLDLPVEVPAHGELRLRADLADGTFRDLDHAYGFGEREYDAASAVLLDASGRVLARDAHLSGGPRRNSLGDPGLAARWECTEGDAWSVAVTAAGLARFVALDLPVNGPCGEGAAAAEDGYVHVLPGETVHLPVSGAVTEAVRRATRVRALDTEPVVVGR